MTMTSIARKALVLLACGGILAACFKSQGVQTGTETGNPPVIDADLVSLVVQRDNVHVVGEEGAVSPGGSDVQAVSDLTGKVFRARSDESGAFDIEVEATPADAFEVSAVRGEQASSIVYVVRGGASVSEAQQEALSCQQRGTLAQSRMGELFDAADRACATVSDCQLASLETACSDACAEVPVSDQGRSEIDAARAAIEDGLCRDFKADGCSVLFLPCPGPTEGSLRCEAGQCVLDTTVASGG